jgi:transcriptional regulator of arginine metabolism
MKAFRQGLILELVGREAITSQEQLRKRLRGRGVDVTQATLSRDIAELALAKHAADGAYRVPGENGAGPVEPVRLRPEGSGGTSPKLEERRRAGALRGAVAEYVRGIDRVRELVVIRTAPGQAGILGIAIDRAALAEVAGTVAGDDTLLVIVRDAKRARALVKTLGEWARR